MPVGHGAHCEPSVGTLRRHRPQCTRRAAERKPAASLAAPSVSAHIPGMPSPRSMSRPTRRPRGRPAPQRLDETAIVVITGTDPDGDALARPAEWRAQDGPPPLIYMGAERSGEPAVG